MTQQTKLLGNSGEDAVASWLLDHGFRVLARNYQIRLGEVDIIATKDDVVAFVEVKTRNTRYFPISQAVTWTKQQRIIKAAKHYVLANRVQDKVLRFDVAAVICENYEFTIEYIPNAFIAQR